MKPGYIKVYVVGELRPLLLEQVKCCPTWLALCWLMDASCAQVPTTKVLLPSNGEEVP